LYTISGLPEIHMLSDLLFQEELHAVTAVKDEVIVEEPKMIIDR
jgi:hypothetical protein